MVLVVIWACIGRDGRQGGQGGLHWTGEFVLHGCSGYSAGQGFDLLELELERQYGHGDR